MARKVGQIIARGDRSWRLLLESPTDGLKLPLQPRREMRAPTVEQVRSF